MLNILNGVKLAQDDSTGDVYAVDCVDGPKKLTGGGGSVFIIRGTTDETFTNAQFDKTPEQICEAYQSGKYCLVYAGGAFLPVVSAGTDNGETHVLCYGIFITRSGQGHVAGGLYVTTDGVTWSIETPAPPTLYNVCINGLQISGPGNQYYTISVDADGNLTATKVHNGR